MSLILQFLQQANYGRFARIKWALRNGGIVLHVLTGIHIALASKGLRNRLRVHYTKYYTIRKTVLPHRT